jgi:DNA (cytosine-5)-methyltransferase 1
MQHILGFQCVGYVEWEDYCQKVIRQRQADGLLHKAPIFGDIRAFNLEYAGKYRGMVDLITGGFPCQDISSAGKGSGISGERSGLWNEMAKAIRTVRPEYVFVENSPMLAVRGLGTVLKDLAEMGFDMQWCCLSCRDCGGPHVRKRIWIMANANGIRRTQNIVYKRADFKITIWGQCQFGELQNSEGFRFQANPDTYGSIDGIPYWMERLKAIGNGQVPIVAATAWKILNMDK